MNIITNSDIEKYHKEGYCILKNAIPEKILAGLDQNCKICIDDIHQLMDESKTDTLGISHRNKRYFIANKYKKMNNNHSKNFLFSDEMATITSKLLGKNVYLFHEQFVVKSAEQGMNFSWHQDSGYIGHPHTTYLTCWIPLVNVNEENGTVFVLPIPESGIREIVPHTQDATTNDKVGYHGKKPGIPVIINRGDLVCFSSITFHRSSANRSSEMRPAYIAQYSPEVIKKKDSNECWGLKDPFIIDGKRRAII
jgi:ectoine hydroxylase-related dioxygenase (phytanoyl-CoA dioxygenase family)